MRKSKNQIKTKTAKMLFDVFALMERVLQTERKVTAINPDHAAALALERKIFSDTWAMIRNHKNIRHFADDAAWAEVVDIARGIMAAGECSPALDQLGRDMATAALRYLDAISYSNDEGRLSDES